MTSSETANPDVLAGPRSPGARRKPGPLGINASIRHGSAVQKLVAAQNAAMRNPRFAPDPVSGTTHCSEAASYIDRATGGDAARLLGDARGNNFAANVQIQHLSAPESGYHAVSPREAQALADRGVTVWVTQIGRQIDRQRRHHGHIASVRPQGVIGDRPRGKSGPLLANIGTFNGVAHQSIVFTPAHGAIVYYAPRQ